jgi:hypothetical protein
VTTTWPGFPIRRPTTVVSPKVAHGVLDAHEKGRLRAAARRAQTLYPGPVGQLISHELLIWEDFGYRFGGHGEIALLVEHVLTAPAP